MNSHERLRKACDDDHILIRYNERFREYSIIRFECDISPVEQGYLAPPGEAVMHGWSILFDPWTGSPLPGSVRDQWFDLAEIVSGNPDFDILDSYLTLPSEMHGEEWWRKREIGPTNYVLDDDWEPPEDVEFRLEELPADVPLGFRRRPGVPPHCCKDLVDPLDDERWTICYLPEVREYGFRRIDPYRPIDHQPIAIEPMACCPWCGGELPASLRSTWLERLQHQGREESSPNIPAALASDSWWRDEGL